MAPKTARRGVLMTASSRRETRAAWRELPGDDDDDEEPSDDDDEPIGEAKGAKESNLEWDKLAREVRQEQRKRFAETEFASGRRDVAPTAYDDVASDASEPEGPPPRPAADDAAPDSAAAATSPAAAAAAAAAAPGAASIIAGQGPSASSTGGAAAPAGHASGASPGEEDHAVPRGAVTAGQVNEQKKRGGTKKTGSQKRKAKQALEEKEEDEDEARKWLRLKLEGEEKVRRIRATRLVHYYDHDSSGALFPRTGGAGASSSSGAATRAPTGAVAEATAAASAAQPPPGDFRSSIRLDLWDDDSDEQP